MTRRRCLLVTVGSAIALCTTLLVPTGAGAASAEAVTRKPTFQDAYADRLAVDGRPSKSLVIAAFEAAFGNLPGRKVRPLPERGLGRHPDGTYVVANMLDIWDDLTTRQQRAVAREIDLTDGGAGASTPASRVAGPVLGAAVPAGGPETPAPHQRDFDTRIADAQREIQRAFGRPLTLTIAWDNGPTGDFVAVARPTASSVAQATFGPSYQPTGCQISFRRSFDPTRADFGNALFVHEVWHCYQFMMIPRGVGMPANWILEGQAEWVNQELRPGHASPAWPEWTSQDRSRLTETPTSLFGLEYNAVGFYQSLRHDLIDPWRVMEPMLQAGSSVAAFTAAGGTRTNLLTTSAKVRVQRDQFPRDWSLTHPGYRNPVSGARQLDVTDDSSDALGPLSLVAYSTQSVVVSTPAAILEVRVQGAPQGAIVAAGGSAITFGTTADRTFRFCQDCVCPSGVPVSGASPVVVARSSSGFLRVAVAVANQSMTSTSVTISARAVARATACSQPTISLPPGSLPRLPTNPPVVQQAVVQALEVFDGASCGATTAQVQANVSDDTGVASVTLSWSFDTGSGLQEGSAPMSLSGGDLYVGTFGPFSSFFNPRTTTALTITATDASGNQTSVATNELDLVDCP